MYAAYHLLVKTKSLCLDLSTIYKALDVYMLLNFMQSTMVGKMTTFKETIG